MPAILATWEAEIKRIMVQDQSQQKARPYLKITQYKMVQVVEHLPSTEFKPQ
jgi:hypothetical protein